MQVGVWRISAADTAARCENDGALGAVLGAELVPLLTILQVVPVGPAQGRRFALKCSGLVDQKT